MFACSFSICVILNIAKDPSELEECFSTLSNKERERMKETKKQRKREKGGWEEGKKEGSKEREGRMEETRKEGIEKCVNLNCL